MQAYNQKYIFFQPILVQVEERTKSNVPFASEVPCKWWNPETPLSLAFLPESLLDHVKLLWIQRFRHRSNNHNAVRQLGDEDLVPHPYLSLKEGCRFLRNWTYSTHRQKRFWTRWSSCGRIFQLYSKCNPRSFHPADARPLRECFA